MEGWVLVREGLAEGVESPRLAVSGRTECLVEERLVTVPQVVAYPVKDPWVAFELEETAGRVAMVLNVSGEAARARVCYGKGTAVSVPNAQGTGATMSGVCAEERVLLIPPYGMASVAVEAGGNSQFSLEGRGEALVLRVLVPAKAGMRTYTVDSTIQFGQVVEKN